MNLSQSRGIGVVLQSAPFRTFDIPSIICYSDKNIWEYREALPFMYKLARQLRVRFYARIKNVCDAKSVMIIQKW